MPEVPDSTPLVWTAGRGGLKRFVAHVLIRLLILSPLPPHAQLTAALFPLSLAWPFLAAAAPERASENPRTNVERAPAESPLSDSLGRGCVAAANRVWEPGILGVGGRIALTDGNLLLSTSGSFIVDPNDPLRGIHAHMLGRGTFITRIKPNPIVVSAGSEVFSNVQLDYRMVPPDPAATQAQVTIDVRDGGRVATLPGTLDPAGGTTTWPSGTVVDVQRTYEARANVEVDGQPVPAFPKRLPFERVPLAVTTKDRLLRIQVALPEQGLFDEWNYSVEVYLARQGEDFPTDPSFEILSQEISNAYPNLDAIWQLGGGSTESQRPWLTRKLDKMELPPGTNTQIRRQAFEISTVFAGYPRVRVIVRSDETGIELEKKDGEVTADLAWSELIEKITNRIRKAGGDFVPIEPILPAPEWFDPLGDLWGRYRGLASAVAAATSDDVISATYTPAMLVGIQDGFFAGLEGDVQAVQWLKQALTTNPVTTARGILDVLRELKRGFPSWQELKNSVLNLYQQTSQYEPGPQELMGLGANYFYYSGFFIGFVYELALSTITVGVLTGGLATAARLGVTALRGVGWIVSIGAKLAAVARVLGYALQWIGRVTGATTAGRALARAALSFLLESRELLAQLAAKYQKTRRISEALTNVLRVSREAAERALYWLTIVDRMSEEAGERLVYFVRNKTAARANSLLTNWTALTNGKRAVKESFEAYEGAADLAEGAHDALITAADRLMPPSATETWPKRYADKYKTSPEGDRVEGSLTRLRSTADDTRFNDEAVAESVRFHAAPESDVPHMSNDGVEGTGRLTNVPCTRVAWAGVMVAAVVIPLAGCGKILPELVEINYPDMLVKTGTPPVSRFEKALENLKLANDVAADEAFARLLWAAHNLDGDTARAVIRAASFPSATPQSVAEYMKAVDWMRDPASPSSIITGLLDQAPGPPPPFPQASINIRRVGNEGAGSLAEGWEPVAIRRLIEGGSPNLPRPFTRADIQAFGPKLDVRLITGGTPQSIEADCLLKDGTFFDMKHSMRADPLITEEQINLLTTVLLDVDQRPIQRAVFVTNAPVGQTLLNKVREANDILKQELNITEDLIRVIEDLGGFPLP